MKLRVSSKETQSDSERGGAYFGTVAPGMRGMFGQWNEEKEGVCFDVGVEVQLTVGRRRRQRRTTAKPSEEGG